MDAYIDRLVHVVEQQQACIVAQGQQIGLLAEQIGLLSQSVVLLLGEELGTPVSEDVPPEAARFDMDGNPY